MLSNRSIPLATVIPVLAYTDVNRAAAWLCDAFGFTVRLRIGQSPGAIERGRGSGDREGNAPERGQRAARDRIFGHGPCRGCGCSL